MSGPASLSGQAMGKACSVSKAIVCCGRVKRLVEAHPGPGFPCGLECGCTYRRSYCGDGSVECRALGHTANSAGTGAPAIRGAPDRRREARLVSLDGNRREPFETGRDAQLIPRVQMQRGGITNTFDRAVWIALER